MIMIDHRNYTRKDLGEALEGVPEFLSAEDIDHYFANLQVEEEWGRIEEEGPITLPVASTKEIQDELGRLRRKGRPAPPHEL